MSSSTETQGKGALCDQSSESAAQDSFFVEKTPGAVYMVKDDPDLTVVFGNEAFFKLFGCTQEDMRHRYAGRLSAFITTGSLREFHALTRQDTEEPIDLRQQIKRDGADAWIYSRVLRLSGGESGMFLCASFDITEDELERRELKKKERQARMIAGHLKIDTFEYDLATGEACIINVHDFFQPQLLGQLPAGEDFALALTEKGLVHPDYAEDFVEIFRSVRKGEARIICEIRMKTGAERYGWARLTLENRREGDGPGRYAVGILENITQQKEMSLKYLNETQFYQAMLSEKTAFGQVDVTEDRITRLGGLWNLYNEFMDRMSYSELIEEFINKVVHPEDRRHYLEIMQRENFIQSLSNGVDKLGCEFRRIVEQNKMMWMELKVHLFREPFTHHVLALIYIMNIDEKKKYELNLLHDSERDHLTNIYNKKVTEALIRDYLKRMDDTEVCAFIILDMDDFKAINDTFGHKMGDRVLVRLAEVLGRAFRKNDIVGRFGGDEFILLLKNIGSRELAEERIEGLYRRLHAEKDPEISLSAGITLIRRGDSYEQAFRQADIALYTAKKKGKGRFDFYSGQSRQEFASGDGNGRAVYAGEILIEEQPMQEEPFDVFLSEQGDMAYLVDPDSFQLLCGNKAFFDRIGMTETECTGIKCYEAIHRRESPCPFCSKANWTTDKFYLWKNMNLALEQEFLVKNKLVQWEGKEALLAIAVDISNNKSVVDSIENGATESHSILSGIQQMAEAASLEDVIGSALEAIGYFFRADAVRFWEKAGEEEDYRCTGEWIRDGRRSENDQEEVNVWLQGRKWEQPVLIESPEAMLCYSYDMYRYMKRNKITNQRWIRLRDGERELGCIDIENITSNFQNVAFLESFTIFITGEIRKRRLMEEILYSNEHDDLTDLLSRNSYMRYLQDYSSDGVSSVGVMLANFNNLKEINTTKGFLMGNFFLRQFADMLKKVFSKDAVFRLNGDEFLAVCANIRREELEEKILELKAMVKEKDSFTVSIGYSWDDVENDLAILIEQSTEAMKVDKKRHYDTNPVSADSDRRKMISELTACLDNREFQVYLQPKVELSVNKIVGAEALIRYRHKDLGIITPDKFIGTLEKNNLIRYIDLFVFEEVCRILDKWGKEGRTLPVISLNFSRLTLLEQDILSSMEEIIARYHVSRKNIEIEITESMVNIGKSILYQAARELYEAGFSIALDDFGTKYTNLSILSEIDFSMLKLDRSLIGTLFEKKNNQIIIKNIIYMCKDLGIEVIAEGVETREQEEVLRELDCRQAQGYLYGKPMPVGEFHDKYISFQ